MFIKNANDEGADGYDGTEILQSEMAVHSRNLNFVHRDCLLIAKPEFSQTHQEDTYIAIVDGEEIHVSEFQRAIRANRAEIIKYFHEKYDRAVCRFWSTPYGDETPLELIKRRHSKTASILKFDRSLLKSRACSPISVTTVLYKISCLKTREGESNQEKSGCFRTRPIYRGNLF